MILYLVTRGLFVRLYVYSETQAGAGARSAVWLISTREYKCGCAVVRLCGYAVMRLCSRADLVVLCEMDCHVFISSCKGDG
jgi:hypothetical protein